VSTRLKFHYTAGVNEKYEEVRSAGIKLSYAVLAVNPSKAKWSAFSVGWTL